MTTRLTGLRIEQFRNAAPCDLKFGDGINVVLGPNGSGKTTLLDLISGILTSPLGEDYAGARLTAELRVDDREISFELRPAAPTASPPGFDEPQRAPDVDVRIDGSPAFSKRGESVDGPHAKPSFKVTRYIRIVEMFVALGVRARTRFESSVRFDESLDIFGAVLRGGATAPEQLRHRMAWVSEHWHLLSSVVFRGDLKDLPREAPGDVEVNPKFLDALKSLAGFTEVTLRLRLLNGSADFAEYGQLTGVFRRGAIAHDFDGLSYGQKRLFAFLLYSEMNPEIIVADELVNGLHHTWIQACVEELKGKQAFLTSQNPLLIDYLEFDSVEQVQKTFILCDVDAQQRFVWRNMDHDEAASFFAAYKVGIQHVGEILRTKGFW